MLDRNRMPAYKSHKTVYALKIGRIQEVPAESHVNVGSWLIVPADGKFPSIEVPHSYMLKHGPQPGGYFVEYEDGYQSYSPAKAFEEGYTRVVDTAPSSDAAIEQEIQAKGLTAPRVTPADIDGNISSEHYFTGADGFYGRHGVDGANPHNPLPQSLGLLTFCVLVLRNGYTVTGESACASPENFDADLGRKIARENAIAKVWPLMGYELKERLYIRSQMAASVADILS